MPIQVFDFLSRDVNLPSRERAQLGMLQRYPLAGARAWAPGFSAPDRAHSSRSGSRRSNGVRRPPPRRRRDYARLRAIVDSVTGGMLDADAEIQIAFGEEPRARLGSRFGSRLGRTAILARPRTSRALRVRVPLTGDVGDGRLGLVVAPA